MGSNQTTGYEGYIVVALVSGIAGLLLWLAYSVLHRSDQVSTRVTDLVLRPLAVIAAFFGGLLLLPILILYLIFFCSHYLLTLPMRRAERARLFLDQIEFALQQGRQVEETLISLAQSRDLTMGVQFHLLVARLEQGLTLTAALEKTPLFLPPQVNAMLAAGRKIGDLDKVLPACRQLLKDAVSQTRGALNYLLLLTFVLTPLAVWILWVIDVFVLPKFEEMWEGFFEGGAHPAAFIFLQHYAGVGITIQACLLLFFILAVIAYAGGPRISRWFPAVQRIHYRLLWRRKRLQRDFSTMLSVLLDSGVPEVEAVTLAADCTANSVFRRRARRTVANLERGVNLTDAIKEMDDSGEFAWRLANAAHGHGAFLKALAGWHDSLDAKAFQLEQAAAHGITTGLVLWSGLVVGSVVISVFGILVAFTNAAILW